MSIKKTSIPDDTEDQKNNHTHSLIHHQEEHNQEETGYSHIPVLTQEVVTGLNLQNNGFYVDATFGGGSHTRALLSANKTITVMSIDWDKEALEHNSQSLTEEFGERFIPVWGSFGHLYRHIKKLGQERISGLVADLGTSQHQLNKEAGFSFRHDTPLDMRMSKAHHQITAADVLNNYSEKDLAALIYTYGEDHRSRKIARLIVEQREKKAFKTTGELAQLMEQYFPTPGKRIHTATQLFQALRIEVNKEFDAIRALLKTATSQLISGGRIACISFHSLEDRLVKQYFQEQRGILEIITKKPITASEEELARNRSARSAKLRIAEKL